MKGIFSAAPLLLLLAVLLLVTHLAAAATHVEPPVDVKSLLQEIEKAKETMTEAGQTVEKTFSVQEVAELVKELQQDRSSFFKRHPSTPLDHLINAFKPFLHDPAGSKALPELFPEIKFQWVRTRDWIFLSTITINPRPHDERKPAVLVRTPYGPTTSNLADLYLLDGYVAVLQDQRGAFLSTGDWDFWREDSQDAYDTMEWIAQQKWSNGKVFTAGISADGCSALTQALFNPPWLVGQFIVWASGEAHDTAYQGGAYRQSLLDGWLTAIGITTRLHSLTVIGDVKEHEAKDSYWNTLSLVDNNAYANITFPAVFWVGWYDIFAFENIEAFNGYQTLTDPSVRGKHVLYVDPGGHCVGSGKASFPDSFTLLPLKLSRDLFKSVISGQPPSNQYSMHMYVMGTALKSQQQSGDYGNYWTSLQDWPKRTPTPYYFQIGGRLSTDKPSTVGTSASYLYDPRDPWPSLGGTNLAPPCGVQDQSKNEARKDVLVFTSDYLSGPVAIVGPIQVTLYVSSNAVDTDFTAFLTDVTPDNSSSLVQDGIRRMRWRNSKVTPSWIQQGEIYEITINLGNTAQVFNKGHRIRVSVSSSNSPRFQVNRNNGKLVKDEGTYVEAINTVHYSANHQSHILLPVVNLADIPENEEIKRLYAVKLDE